jgi:hypothetical protein
MKIPLQPEEFVLNSLHVDWAPPSPGKAASPKSTRMLFDYSMGTHIADPLRHRMTFKAEFLEMAEDELPQGYRIQPEIVGFFQIDPELPEERRQAQVRINGVSQLYSTLRGLIAATTGSFPGGKFVLPSILPQDVVRQIEEKRSQSLLKRSARAKTSPPASSNPDRE